MVNSLDRHQMVLIPFRANIFRPYHDQDIDMYYKYNT